MDEGIIKSLFQATLLVSSIMRELGKVYKTVAFSPVFHMEGSQHGPLYSTLYHISELSGSGYQH